MAPEGTLEFGMGMYGTMFFGCQPTPILSNRRVGFGGFSEIRPERRPRPPFGQAGPTGEPSFDSPKGQRGTRDGRHVSQM